MEIFFSVLNRHDVISIDEHIADNGWKNDKDKSCQNFVNKPKYPTTEQCWVQITIWVQGFKEEHEKMNVYDINIVQLLVKDIFCQLFGLRQNLVEPSTCII